MLKKKQCSVKTHKIKDPVCRASKYARTFGNWRTARPLQSFHRITFFFLWHLWNHFTFI